MGDKVNAVKDFAIDKILRIRTVNDLHLERAESCYDHPAMLFLACGKRLRMPVVMKEGLDAFRDVEQKVSCDNMFYVMMRRCLHFPLKRFDGAEDHYKVAHYIQHCSCTHCISCYCCYESGKRTEDANRLAASDIGFQS